MTVTLAEILEHKRVEIEEAKQRLPMKRLLGMTYSDRKVRDFSAALRKDGRLALIGEIKSASPSAGIIINPSEFYPSDIALQYAKGGAAALSVLTDSKYFSGSFNHLSAARHATNLPVLRKDFIISEYQVYESAYHNADAILLIAAAMNKGKLRELYNLASAQLGMHVLIEIHAESELEEALRTGCQNIGINNRDLNTQTTDLGITERLAPKIPRDRTIVSESGIRTYEEIKRLNAFGVHAALVGESLLRQHNIEQAVQDLIGYELAK